MDSAGYIDEYIMHITTMNEKRSREHKGCIGGFERKKRKGQML